MISTEIKRNQMIANVTVSVFVIVFVITIFVVVIRAKTTTIR